MAQQQAYNFGQFLSGLIRAQAAGLDIGDIGRARTAVAASPIREQRAALFRALQTTEGGRRILSAFDRCFQTGDCKISPEMAEEFKRLNTDAARTAPRSPAQQKRYDASRRSRARRAVGPSLVGLTEAQCTGRGVWVPASEVTGLEAYCRRPGSPQGPGARRPMTSLFRRLRRRDPSTATIERCLAFGGNPQLPSNWRQGDPITACRSPVRASPYGPRPVIAGVELPAAAAAGALVAGADLYDGEEYEYDDEYDGEDQYDGEGGNPNGFGETGDYGQAGGFGGYGARSGQSGSPSSSSRGIFGMEDMEQAGDRGQDSRLDELLGRYAGSSGQSRYDQYDSRRR